jgi:predicted dehydrogenase
VSRPHSDSSLDLLVIGGDPPGHLDLVLEVPRHFPGLRLAGLALSHKSEPEKARLEKAASQHGIPFVTDWRDLIGQASAAIHLGPYGLRAATIRELLGEGNLRLLIVDKPVACSLEELAEVEAEIKARPQLLAFPLLTLRFDPRYELMREIYRGGLLGQARFVQASRPHKLGTRPHWFFDEAMYPGLIADLCVHDVDVATWITGKHMTRIVSACEIPVDVGGKTISGFGGFAAEMSNGGVATISADWFVPMDAPYHGDCRLEIVGDNGKATLISDGPRVGILVEVFDSKSAQTFPGLFTGFLDRLRSEGVSPDLWHLEPVGDSAGVWMATYPEPTSDAISWRAFGCLQRHLDSPHGVLPATFDDLARATRIVLKASRMARG